MPQRRDKSVSHSMNLARAERELDSMYRDLLHMLDSAHDLELQILQALSELQVAIELDIDLYSSPTINQETMGTPTDGPHPNPGTLPAKADSTDAV